MARIPSPTRSLSTAVSTARPIVLGTLGRLTGVAGRLPVLSRLRRDDPGRPETFSPSLAPPESQDAGPVTPTPSPTPSPATVARNVGAPRPSVTPRATKPRSAPGAKLPVRRANPST